MGSHPVNLAFRFVLELLALGALGFWGWAEHDGLGRWLWAIGLPVLVALLWGIFAVPGDPSRSGQAPVPTPGTLRLLLELSIFAAGVVALIASQRVTAAILLAAMVLLHYAVSYDRVIWLLKR